MKKIFKNESSQYIAFVAVVLLSRVPFLFSGYGLDADTWEVALTAKRISESGTYEVSRFPGYPVHELLCALFYNGRYVSLNLLTTIISTIGILFFTITLKTLRFKKPFLAGLALAAVPVVYIYSAATIDYTWALAFILIALYFIVVERPVIAGVFLGIAIGCRITSGAMLLPFAIMISQTDGARNNLIRILKLALSACVVGVLLFLPVFLRYGAEFFSYYDVPYPSIPKVLYKLSIEVWGIAGFIGIILATALLFLPNTITARKYLFPRSVNEKYVIAWLVAIDLYIIAFLKLPMEAGYLIPIVPFVILIFGKYLYDKAFTFFACTLIVAPFIMNISPSDRDDSPDPSALAMHFKAADENLVLDPLKGPLPSYQSRRENAMRFTDQFLRTIDTIHQKTLFISGRWYTQIAFARKDTSENMEKFVDYVNKEDLLRYIEQGYAIYYLPQQDYFNLLKYDFDIKTFGAIAFYKNGH